MPERLAKKLLIIGWDAADWQMIEPLMLRGLMPNLQKLIKRGVHADLSTLEPKLSPLLWSSIATGKTADKHGILNFIEPNPSGEGVRVSSSTTRKTKAIWNILTQQKMRINVVSWYASHPAEPINGVCVTNLFQENAPATSPSARDPWPLPEGAVHPKELAGKISAQRMHPTQVVESMLRTMIAKVNKLDPRDPKLLTLRKLVAQCQSVHRAALAILRHEKPSNGWDCTMVFYDSIDTIGHHFMEFYPPRMAHVSEREFDLYHNVMNGVYQLHDALLGELLKAAGEDVTVMLLSDHGFYNDQMRPRTADLPQNERAAIEAAWHRPTGVLVMAGPGVKTTGERIPGAGLLDITPTALTLLGLPVGQDMDGRAIANAFAQPPQITSVPSWDAIEGDSGLHPTDMRQDPFESQDALKQLVDLGYIAAPSEDAAARLDLTRRETQFNLATVYQTTNRAALATPIFESLVAQQPDEIRYIMRLAHCYYGLMQWKKCIALLHTLLMKKPKYAEARLLLSAAMASNNEQNAAHEQLKILESDAGDDHKLLAPLGDGYSVLQRWEEAEKFYRRALAIEPKNAHALHGLARALVSQNRFEEAVDRCLDVLEINQNFADAHHLLGVALAWLDQPEHAIQSFTMAVLLQPGMLDAHRFLELLYRQQGDDAKAQMHRQAAEQLRAQAGDLPSRQEMVNGALDFARQRGAKVVTR